MAGTVEEIVTRHNTNRSWVFTENSIGFNGALGNDQAMSKIMQNACAATLL